MHIYIYVHIYICIYIYIHIWHQWRHHQEAKDVEAWEDHSLVTNVSGIYRTYLDRWIG